MQLGNFSASLAVNDLQKSRAFYEALGFAVTGGDEAHNFLILQNDSATIGLFQGMFEKNILTFNPGRDRTGNTLDTSTDIRDIQEALKAKGLTLAEDINPSSKGPAHITLLDPDGNPVLIDQHV